MTFKITTDYAIRILCYLNEHEEELPTASILSEKTGTPPSYLSQVAGNLRQAGLLKTELGRYGGYKLARKAEEISFYDVVRVTEGDICISRCLVEEKFCSINSACEVKVREVFQDLQNEVINRLKSVYIADMM